MWNNKGLSLIEVMVSMSIFMLIFILGTNFIITGFKSFTFNDDQQVAIQNARRALNSISLDVREAGNSERGDYAIDTIDSQNFIWYGDIDNDDQKEKIQYYLSTDNKLYRVVTEPGALNNYDGAISTTTIASYVNNQTEAIFEYYDSENNLSSTINFIRLVKVILKINVTPGVAPNDYYVETDIQLRNLKDNL